MQSRNSIGIAALVAAAGLAFAPDARAQADSALNWNNAAGGAASTTTNWSPNQMPTAADDLTFPLLGAYTITFSNLVPSARTHTYRQGAITLSLSSPHTVSTGITVADLSGDVTTVTLTTGTLNSTAAVIIGDASGSSGALNVNDDDADLILTTAAGDLTVGNGGAGGLHVTGGGLVRVGDRFTAGASSTSVSDVTVSGFTLTPVASSFLDVLGTGAAAAIGAGGDATFSVTSGGQAHFAGALNIAQGSASTSVAEVNGIGLLNSTLAVGGDLNIAGNQSAGAAAGNGTLTINPDGVVEVTGTTNVGNDPDGGTGVLNVAGGRLTTGSLIVNDLQGTLNFSDGRIEVDGGTFDPQGIAFTLNGLNVPRIQLLNGATCTLAGISFGLRLGVTASTHGEFWVNSGSTLTVNSATILGDQAADAYGDLRFLSAAPSVLGAITVGNSGIGLLSVGDSQVTSGTTSMGIAAGGSGSYAVSGPTGVHTVNGGFFIGGTSAASVGTADATVATGGLLHVTGNAQLWNIASSLLIQAGTMTVDGVLTLRGPTTLEDGTINSANLIRLTGGSISGHGIVNGGVLATSGASITAIGGPLTMGNASPTGNVDIGSASSLNVGAQTVTLLGTNSAPMHTLVIAGGILDAANGITLLSGTSASGNGLIDAPVTLNGGAITASGAGLRFGGVVTRSAGTMSGTTIGFNNGGGYAGAGAISAIVDFDAGSTCSNTGILSMGNAASNFGVTIDGTLLCGGGTVTLLDANGIGLGFVTDLRGGNLVCTQNLTVNAGRTIEGTGFVQTPLLTLAGNIKPADHPSEPPHRGTLNVSGAATMTATNTYFCDIDPGVEFPTSDRITASGPLTIAGNLTVAFIDGYVPAGPHTFDIAIGSSRTGTFATTTIPPVGLFGPAHVEYFPDRARLVMCYANCDGSVTAPTLNVLDFACFLNKFAAADAYANCDGSTTPPVLNVLDFACFLNKFAAGCP